MTNNTAPLDSHPSTSIMDVTPGKEMEIDQLPYQKYRSSQRNLTKPEERPNKL